MDMPQVARCQVRECAYNSSGACHALAITVGDENTAKCDTFFAIPQKGGDPQAVGRVGACKVTACLYNDMLECQAASITVDMPNGEADCMTFREE
jgi:hypothetical protein